MIQQSQVAAPQISCIQSGAGFRKQAASTAGLGIKFKDIFNTAAQRDVEVYRDKTDAGKDGRFSKGHISIDKNKDKYDAYHKLEEDKKSILDSRNTLKNKKIFKCFYDIADKTEKRNDSGKELNTLLAALSQLFGVETESLRELFVQADIKVEALTCISKNDEVCEKLAAFLELGVHQESLLKDIVDTVSIFLRDNSGKFDTAYAKTTGDFNQSVELNPNNELKFTGECENIKNNKITPAISTSLQSIQDSNEMLSKMKLRFHELLQKAEADPQNFLDDILKETEIFFLKAEKGQDIFDGLEATEENVKPGNSENAVKPESNGIKKEETTKRKPDLDDFPERSNMEEIEISKDKLPFENNGEEVYLSNQAAFRITGEYKAQKPVDGAKEPHIIDNEIINQVINNAKVTTIDDKTEAVIQLKPESLGRLSLKIVTENGIVTAKFIAESRQVKQVLETNMNFLKDSLEKQGLQVQSLSVSVNQNPAGSFNSKRQFSAGEARSYSQDVSVETGMVNTMDLEKIRQRMDSYYWKDSKINLTA